VFKSDSLLSEVLRIAALGLVIGGLGGLAVPGRSALAWVWASALGTGGALFGGFLAGLLFSSGFSGTRLALAGLVSALLVCCWTLYERERQLPR
jgi:uncharacterized membrane protein YeaQ/YmgE (transglycosylase-associated protein family)